MRINREILKIAIPNILGNITIPLLGIVDTALMGHESQNHLLYIGAIGLGGLIFNAIYWNLGFLRISTTGITAQAFGEGNIEQQSLTLFRALFVGIVLAFLLLLLQEHIARLGFSLLSNAENQQAITFARQYFSIRIWGAPAVLLLFGLRGWFYGIQNARYPMIITIVINAINIVASIYFVKEKHLGVQGVAWGTLIAQYAGLFVAFFLYFFTYKNTIRFFKTKLLLITLQLKRFFFVSGFIFVRNVLLFAVFSGFSYYSSAVGEDYFAMNQILLELFFLMSFAVDGFAYASEALVGRFKGEKNSKMQRETVKYTLFWGLGFGSLYALLYIVAGDKLFGLFTNDNQLVEMAKSYFVWISLICVIGSIAFIWDGVYAGATMVVPMALSMAVATIFYFITFGLLKDYYPRHAIWIAMTNYMFIRALLQGIIYFRTQKAFL